MYIEHPDEHPVIKIFQFNFSIIIGKHNTSVYLHIFDIPVIVLRMLCVSKLVVDIKSYNFNHWVAADLEVLFIK